MGGETEIEKMDDMPTRPLTPTEFCHHRREIVQGIDAQVRYSHRAQTYLSAIPYGYVEPCHGVENGGFPRAREADQSDFHGDL